MTNFLKLKKKVIAEMTTEAVSLNPSLTLAPALGVTR
jgi:hypothetical protein